MRTLLINIDDIGIHPAAIEAAIETIDHGVAASGSVMAVTDGSDRALRVLADRPDLAIGVHLILTRDLPGWHWSPLTSGPTIHHDGLLAPIDARDQLLAGAAVADVETEFRAQIEKVLAYGITPTHLDWHCLADGGREDIFDATLDLAQEYALGIRAWTDHGRATLAATGRVVQDHAFVDSFALPVDGKTEHLIHLIEQLPDGLTEWAMHPAAATTADPGSPVRASDRRALLSPAVAAALRAHDITVMGHRRPEH